MRIATLSWLAALAACLGGALDAQEPDPAEAYGIYRPPPPPQPDTGAAAAERADTVAAAADTGTAGTNPAAPDTGSSVVEVPAALAADSARRAAGGVSPDSVMPVGVEEAVQDTSLTARMDVARGGGLRREEFPDLRESARLTGRYRVFLDLMARSGLGGALTDTSAVTLLAPTDSAFARLEPAALERLRSDSATRARWASALVLPGEWTLADLLRVGAVPSLGGTARTFGRGPRGVPVAGNARVVQPDLIARNGRLHGVDRVVLPAPDTSVTSAVP